MGKRKINTETITFPHTEYIHDGNIYKIIPNEIQTSLKGVKFKYKSITKNQHVNSIWVNGVEKWHWIYKFEYIDFSKKGFTIEIDYYNEIKHFKEY